MEVRIIVETTAEAGEKRRQELHHICMPGQGHCGLGLKLEHGKELLAELQRAILNHQIQEIANASRIRPCCGRISPIHDYRTRLLDTLFGRFPLKVPRRRKCSCRAGKSGVLTRLEQVFRDRATPKLKTLQAELGARHSFQEAARILETFLPSTKQRNITVRNRLSNVAN